MQVSFSPQFNKSLHRLEIADVKKVSSVIELIQHSSFPIPLSTVKALKGHRNVYRIRKGKLRIIIYIKGNMANFQEVGFRKDVYKKF